MNVMALTPVRPGCARAAFAAREPADAAPTGNHVDEDLMTRRQVASLFGVTSAAVASWARRGRLPEVRTRPGGPGTGARTWRRCSGAACGEGRDDRAVRPVRDS